MPDHEDHYIIGKLANELLPWMVAGKRVKKQWFVTAESVNGYVVDVSAALAGLGIGSPIAGWISGATPDADAKGFLQSVLPGVWFYVGLAALAVWVLSRVVLQRQEVVARALLAKEYGRSMHGLFAQLERALSTPDPMPQISAIQKTVDDKVLDAIKNGIWPFDPPLPADSGIRSEVNALVSRYRMTYMKDWKAPPPGVLV